MSKYILRRFSQLMLIILVITFLTFTMMHLAGSDAVIQKMENSGMLISQDLIDAARSDLGLDKPFFTQYLNWLFNLVQGNMGISYISGKDVFSLFISKLPASIVLALSSLLLTICISLPLGILAAVKQGSFVDKIIRLTSFIGNSLPNFFVALLLMYFFAIKLNLLPLISQGTSIQSLILPSLSLAIAMSAKYIRQLRACILDELSKDYVIGAQARGVTFTTTLVKSVLRSCLVTIVTLLSLSLGSLLGGSAIVESIFMWDGVGKLAVDAIYMRDYPIILAYVMWMAILYVCINLIADLSYRLLDPRIKIEGEGL